MSDLWDAAPFPNLQLQDSGSTYSLADPVLVGPTIVRTSSSLNGTITYGLVAKVGLSRPGYGCRVEHDLPVGVELVEVQPKATVVGDHLIWLFPRLDPGQELRLLIVVRPEPGTELNPEEQATFTATYSQNLYFQAPIARPRLAARLSGPAEAEVGDIVEFLLDVVNTGNWTVTEVQVEIELPHQYSHPDGPGFHLQLGSVAAGESHRVTIPAIANIAGSAIIRAEVTGSPDREAHVEFASLVREVELPIQQCDKQIRARSESLRAE